MHHDLEVAEDLADTLHQPLRALTAGGLPGGQGDVVPVGRHHLVEQVRVAAEAAIERGDNVVGGLGHHIS